MLDDVLENAFYSGGFPLVRPHIAATRTSFLQTPSLISHRPAVENICDVCGEPLVPRPDDTIEALADRLCVYHAKTEPVLDLFRRKELVLDIDGTQPPDEIQSDISVAPSKYKGSGQLDEPGSPSSKIAFANV